MDLSDKENDCSGRAPLRALRAAEPLTQSDDAEHAQDAQAPLAPNTAPLGVGGGIPQDSTTTMPSRKPPNQPRKMRPPKQGPSLMSPKDFKENMIKFRLDHWKARAQVVYTSGQVDMTSLWSPQWSGVVSCNEGMNLFDGFDRTWFVPFDMETPLPADKKDIADNLQKRRQALSDMYHTKIAKDAQFHSKLLRAMEEEVKATCRNQWDTNFHESDETPKQWAEVRKIYELTNLVHMIARARLADGKELLPGYCQVIVLELAADGKILSQRVSVPTNIGLNEFLSRLDSRDPPDTEQDKHLIDTIRRKLDIILTRGDEAQKNKAARFSCQVDKFGEIEAAGSEKFSWIFQLRVHTKYSIPFGKSPDAVHTWSQLKEANFQGLLDGIRAKKHPVFVRKIRLRRMWPQVDEMEKQLQPTYGLPELSQEQLDIVDAMLAGQTDEEKQQGAMLTRALEIEKQQALHPKRPSTDDFNE
ncbi:hypothetical protein FSARC_9080 [Fusarium sarcochroum]|uniref:Uncharacterized protein n=1 Tax=Fusarium sarcochroum TaxID=1208366 RepID=A0A8H4X5N8_9HYPO|nr:hypothetical protein FSARC_9080 [Fusarium sarcochroum]